MSLFSEARRYMPPAIVPPERKNFLKPPITMGIVGDSGVITNLCRAAELRREGESAANDYHFVGIWPGNGQASIIQEGQMRALIEMGLLPLFDGDMVGSGASGVVFAGKYGLAEPWGDIFPEANPALPLVRRGRLDIDGLGGIFRARTPEQFPADTPTHDIFVSLTHAKSGKSDNVRLDPHNNPLELLLASMSIPGMSNPRNVHGEPYIDGMVGEPLPISRVLNGSNFPDVNNIILFLAAPLEEKDLVVAVAGQLWELFGGNTHTATLLRTQDERIRREVDFVLGKRKAVNRLGQPVQIVAIGPVESSLSTLTMNGPKLTRARDIAQDYLTGIFENSRR